MIVITSGNWQTSPRVLVLLWVWIAIQAVIFATLFFINRLAFTLLPLLASIVLLECGVAFRIAEYHKRTQLWGTFRQTLQGPAGAIGALVSGLGFWLAGAGLLIILRDSLFSASGSRLAMASLFSLLAVAMLGLGGYVVLAFARARLRRS